MGLREAILDRDDLPRVAVEVPEWGVSLFVRTLTAGERERFEWSYASKTPGLRALLAVMTCVDETGMPVFTQADAKTLETKSGKALARIWDAALALNFGSAKDIDELEKNCEAVRPAD